MNISKQIFGGVTVVGPVGALDARTVPDLDQRLSQLIPNHTVRLVVDLSQVPYMASAGIRVLVAALQSARRQSGDLRLASVQPAVARMLELAGLQQLVNIYPDVAAAVESFS
jgi:anti-sigma B factor antagonist